MRSSDERRHWAARPTTRAAFGGRADIAECIMWAFGFAIGLQAPWRNVGDGRTIRQAERRLTTEDQTMTIDDLCKQGILDYHFCCWADDLLPFFNVFNSAPVAARKVFAGVRTFQKLDFDLFLTGEWDYCGSSEAYDKCRQSILANPIVAVAALDAVDLIQTARLTYLRGLARQDVVELNPTGRRNLEQLGIIMAAMERVRAFHAGERQKLAKVEGWIRESMAGAKDAGAQDNHSGRDESL